MGKLRTVCCIVGVLALGLFMVGCSKTASTVPDKASPSPLASPSSRPEATVSPEKEEEKTPLEEAYDVITASLLQDGEKAYNVDQAFLDYIAKNYGEEVILKVADTLRHEKYNANIWIEYTKKSLHVLIDEYKGILSSKKLQQEAHTYVVGNGAYEKESITLRFAGDINFAENWSTMRFMDQQKNGINDCFSAELMSVMKSADLFMLNNEFTYSTGGTPLPNKDYTFRANPKRVKLLHQLGVDLVSLANNHSYDYGEEALVDTFTTLEKEKIPYVGAGRNLEEAMRPVYYIINGRKIAIVSATQVERGTLYTKEATKDHAGVLRTKDPTKFVTVIEQAKRESDYVIVYVHWGTEHQEYIDGSQRPLANAFIDAGADVIIGAHTHCLQGFEYYKGKPILYSLGNYWFNKRTLDTGLMEIELFGSGEIQYKFVPCIQKNQRTKLVTSGEKSRILNYMEKISYGVDIDENGVVTNKQ